MRKLFNGLLVACVLAMFSLNAYAHKQVVVIPLGGDSVPVYEVGKTGPAEGIVFHVTDEGIHGLEAEPEDHVTGAFWGCTTISDVDNLPNLATLDSNTGAHNTQAILDAGCGTAHTAGVTRSYMRPNGITTDWYLPNREELDLLYGAKVNDVVGGFVSANYWSSSQFNDSFAWNQVFSNGVQSIDSKINPYRVRAVRAF